MSGNPDDYGNRKQSRPGEQRGNSHDNFWSMIARQLGKGIGPVKNVERSETPEERAMKMAASCPDTVDRPPEEPKIHCDVPPGSDEPTQPSLMFSAEDLLPYKKSGAGQDFGIQ